MGVSPEQTPLTSGADPDKWVDSGTIISLPLILRDGIVHIHFFSLKSLGIMKGENQAYLGGWWYL